jgi:hypothetical protein
VNVLVPDFDTMFTQAAASATELRRELAGHDLELANGLLAERDACCR